MEGVKASVSCIAYIISFILIYHDLLRVENGPRFHILNVVAFSIIALLSCLDGIKLINVIGMFPLGLIDYIYISLFFRDLCRYPIIYLFINITFHHLPLVFINNNTSSLRLFIMVLFLFVIKFYYDVLPATRSNEDHIYDIFLTILIIARTMMSMYQKTVLIGERLLCISGFAICDAAINYKTSLIEISNINKPDLINSIYVTCAYMMPIFMLFNTVTIDFSFFMIFNIMCTVVAFLINFKLLAASPNMLFADYMIRNTAFLVQGFNVVLAILLYLESLRKAPVNTNTSLQDEFITRPEPLDNYVFHNFSL